MSIYNDLPKVRGTLEADVVLAPFTWFRVGGPAQALFQPVDEDDLADFLRACPAHIPIMVFGVGSNLMRRREVEQ